MGTRRTRLALIMSASRRCARSKRAENRGIFRKRFRPDGSGRIERAPDTVLLDINLPDALGLDLAPQLKALCRDRALRIII